MKWSWSLEQGSLVLRPAPGIPGTEVGFVGRSLSVPERLPLDESRLVRLAQVHGTAVARAEAPGSFAASDAVYSETPGLVLTVRTADCLPVALVSTRGAALVHAGWRGLADGVLEATLLHFDRAPVLHAVLGPAIGPCCFEVGPEVAARFPETVVRTLHGRRPRVDLAARAREIVVERFPEARITDPGPCTRCHQHLVHSHRGSGGAPGRILAYARTGEATAPR